MIIDDRLDRRSWRATVAHEAAHHERGGSAEHHGQPRTWDAVVERDELACDNQAARWVVPLDELVPWLAARGDEPTTIADIAEQWDVPEWIAEVAAALVRHPARWRAGDPAMRNGS